MKHFSVLVILVCIALGCNEKKSDEQRGEISTDSTKNEAPIKKSFFKGQQSYFFASGTEPFWSIAIFEEKIVFKTPSDSVTTPHAQPTKVADAYKTQYNVVTDSVELHIDIQKQECMNAMSGANSPYTVSIQLKYNTETEFQKMTGCGHYNTDYRLHDIWLLETLNGKKVVQEDFNEELPTMEINAAENTFMGYAGCNRMNGALFFEKDLLRFTNIRTTKMMCDTNNKESEFLQALQNGTTYSIENNRLTLSNADGIQTVFKKID